MLKLKFQGEGWVITIQDYDYSTLGFTRLRWLDIGGLAGHDWRLPLEPHFNGQSQTQ